MIYALLEYNKSILLSKSKGKDIVCVDSCTSTRLKMHFTWGRRQNQILATTVWATPTQYFFV
jgi:hypothetical protein